MNVGVIAPVIGITAGEIAAASREAAERLMVHVVHGIATAAIAERLASDLERRH